MKKYFKTTHYISKDKQVNVYVNYYTTKKGILKFNIKIYVELSYNDSGFCSCVANYNTCENSLINFLELSEKFDLIGR